MNLEKVVAVSGLPGLYNLVATRNNGLIIEDMDSGARKFVSVREHAFTPLASVSIFTYDDPVEIDKIFQNMQQHLSTHDPAAIIQQANPKISAYFEIILPDYDRDRVHIGDMKKVLKWFTFLHERGLLSETTGAIEAEKEEE